MVVLTGDIHSSWANDIPSDHTSRGVDARSASSSSARRSPATASTSSSRASLPAGTPVAVALGATEGVIGAVTATNPWVKYLDGIGHGFTLIDVTPERVQADYFLTPVPTDALPDPRVDPTVVPVYARSFQTVAGSRQVSAATGPVGPRSDTPHSR